MSWIEIFGFAAGVVTAIGMMPQLVKTVKTKKVDELSIQMFLIYLLGFIMWITYGVVQEDLPIVVTNSISVILTLIMIYLKIRFSKKS
jgi:MtN3 and saliva related transmembrane protein